MLKKAGIAAAVAAAGLLALSPMAFAKDKEDQDNRQFSVQGEGEANGKNIISGMTGQFGCKDFSDGAPVTVQGGGTCTDNGGSATEQETTQSRSNN